MPGMLRDIIIIRHLKKIIKDPSIFPHRKGQMPEEWGLFSSFKSHCFGLIKRCGVISLLLLLIFFNKAPTDPFLPYPVNVSQATPLCKFALIPTACWSALPHGLGSRFNQFWLNSEYLSSHQQSDAGNTKGKASNYPKLSETMFLVLRAK